MQIQRNSNQLLLHSINEERNHFDRKKYTFIHDALSIMQFIIARVELHRARRGERLMKTSNLSKLKYETCSSRSGKESYRKLLNIPDSKNSVLDFPRLLHFL